MRIDQLGLCAGRKAGTTAHSQELVLDDMFSKMVSSVHYGTRPHTLQDTRMGFDR